jgi:hypothetical protein
MKNTFKPLFFILAFVSLAPLSGAVGLGVSPSRLIHDNLIRGAHVEREIVLSRSDATDELFFKVQPEGTIAAWLTTNHGDSFTIPSGQQRFPVTIMMDVPEDASNGSYKGNLRFVSSISPADSQEAASGANGVGVSVDAVVQASLEITGDQLLEFAVSSIDIPTMEEGWPLQAVLLLENTGNVSAAPTKVKIEFWDKFRKEFITVLESNDFSNIQPVHAFTRGDFVVPIENDFKVGQYWGLVEAYEGERLIAEADVIFDVVEPGSINKKGLLKNFSSAAVDPEPGDLVKLEGVFENTGASNVIAKLIVEIERDGKLVEVLQSNSVGVSTGKEESLSVLFTPQVNGHHKVKAHIEYSGKKTNEEKISFQVGQSFPAWIYAAIGILTLIITILMALVMKKKSKDRKNKPETLPAFTEND